MQELTVYEALALALENNIPFYAYRLPGNPDVCFGAQLSGEVRIFDRMIWEDGFVVVPFEESEVVPSFFIRAEVSFCNATADSDMIGRLKEKRKDKETRCPEKSVTREEYDRQVTEMIAALQRGEALKMVLSRGMTLETNGYRRSATWFQKMTENYPDAFVFLVSVPGMTAWMGATPEIFLEQTANYARTMALAGTRPAGALGEWGGKEEEEQEIVARSIASLLEEGNGWSVEGPFSHRAGQVEHLCTVFTSASPLSIAAIDRLRRVLHPTPAVGGFPTRKVLPMIRSIEGRDRRYYAGYVGPVHRDKTFHWFVNLRSMEVFREAVHLHIGGGITALSDPAKEWEETELKSRTLLDIISGGR